MQINQADEENIVRFMPQSINIIAKKTASEEFYIFAYVNYPTKPSNDEVKPDLILLGHKRKGCGLAWSVANQGYLVPGSDDNLICVWDVNKPN